MLKRALTAVVLVAAVALPVVPAHAAQAGTAVTGSAQQGAVSQPREVPADPRSDRAAKATKTKAAKAKATKTKARKAFVHQGRLVGVDVAASTLTLRVTGGSERAARGTTVTVTVAAGALVRRDGAASALTALVVGDRVTVKGTRAAGVLTVQRLNATSRDTVAAAGRS
ncbi:MAG TPA: hypothetical protein VF661_02635 [Actinomycetales bacterium]|jgi:hypothetical protein